MPLPAPLDEPPTPATPAVLLVSVSAAAVMLRVPERTVAAWQARGRLGCHDVNGRPMAPLADVQKIANSRVRRLTEAARKQYDLDADDEPLTQSDMDALRDLFT